MGARVPRRMLLEMGAAQDTTFGSRGPILLTTPIGAVPGVGSREAMALHRLGIVSAAHLVHYIPFRYEFEHAEGGIGDLRPGTIGSARGEVGETRIAGHPRRRRFEAVLLDDTGRIEIVWFNQPYMARRLEPGMRLHVQGQVRRHDSSLQMANPIYEILKEGRDEPAARGARLRPVYPASDDIDSRRIEELVRQTLGEALPQIEDHLPEAYRQSPGACRAARRLPDDSSTGFERADARREATADLR